MSALRKMQRQKNGEVAKQVLKKAKPKLKMAEQARRIVRNNHMRIYTYCQTYFFPMFGWVMYKHFGFGFRRLSRLDAEMKHIWDLIIESREGPHVYYRIEWVFSDIEIESGFKYVRCEKPELKPSKLETTEAFVEHFARCASIDIIADIEVVWLWVLYAAFGFGKKRLAKAREYLMECVDLSYKEFMGRLDEMEKKCTWKHGDEHDGVAFATVRQRLAALGIEGPEMILPMCT